MPYNRFYLFAGTGHTKQSKSFITHLNDLFRDFPISIISGCRHDIHPRRLMLDIFPRITGGSPLLYHYTNEKLR